VVCWYQHKTQFNNRQKRLYSIYWV